MQLLRACRELNPTDDGGVGCVRAQTRRSGPTCSAVELVGAAVGVDQVGRVLSAAAVVMAAT